jgi:DNA topoisomerase-2
MKPWYKGFIGTIEEKNDKFISYGKYEIKNESTLIITELPIGISVDKYKEFLEKMIVDKKKGYIYKYFNKSYGNHINIVIYFNDNKLQQIIKKENIIDVMKLSSSISMTNMHLYNENGVITKYEIVEDIMLDFYKFRIKIYEKRKKYVIEKLQYNLSVLENKVRFIKFVIEKKIIIEKRKKKEILEKLEELEFMKIDNNYDYLINMPLHVLTLEKIEEYDDEYNKTKKELKEYEKLSVQQLWLNELDELEVAYNKWLVDEIKNENKICKTIKTDKIRKPRKPRNKTK